ncbi:metal ABC transporter solute-binding protein, Zn/Mn family [Paenactinomyces guangxiensis]|uniref:Zinc ABC transporter substrate-binding protein n=1 Tax=Paenactinomyces guangxiensis TaxID=1490290 RepID=A0A7W1WP42_9BACL|nr:zinc ABC transporter substrate-binding protein [Paenactinomyces guangxiensis]MBA4493334.1 zinc ABC transporter substrate-binding protein [Paenactinomyces guangxiensis]MBH8593440.1 zinc ABC transporter substrate-binding protein [Paenactinomyces guangxiensis]
MKRWLRILVSVSFIPPLLFVSACGSSSAGKAMGPLQVTTTTGMIADLVENVGGKHVQVTGLMGPGVDPHLYKASQGDIEKLDEADVIFYNGLHLEGKMTDIFTKMAHSKPVIPVAEKIDEKLLLETADGQNDPHIWFDVQLWMKATERVKEGLIEIDPAHKKDYEQQAAAYLKKLAELDQYAKQQLNTIPKERRVLVTAHDAFSYFGRAYEIEVVGLQGISTASEYGLKDVQRIVNLLTERKIKAVFVESSVSKRPIEAVVQGAKKKNHEVTIGGTLFSDAMGEKGTEEGTYIGMVRHNIDTIVKALK